MKPGPNGYAPNAGFAAWVDDWIGKQPFFRDLDLRISSLDPVLDSANAKPGDWLTLSDIIEAKANEADAVVVLHGTDTMAYAASAASFLLRDLEKPVIFTGAQVPAVCRGSDAEENLRGALRCAEAGLTREVCIFFGGTLLRANRATKMGTTGEVAFTSPHWPPLAEGTDNPLFSRPTSKRTDKPYSRPRRNEHLPAVGLLKLFPGLDTQLLHAAAEIYRDGLVLELFGSGNGPAAYDGFAATLKDLSENELPIVGISQCPYGRLEPGAYVSGGLLLANGLIPGLDLTTEAALTKLFCIRLFSTPTTEIAYAMQTPFAGEMASRSAYLGYLSE